MMIDRRLIREVDSSMKYIRRNVACQWGMLVLNIVVIAAVSWFLQQVIQRSMRPLSAALVLMMAVVCIALRWKLCRMASINGDLASREVKQHLRTKIYRKLLALGSGYRDHVSTSEVIQVSVEGVDQLETYFSGYLPHFFYSMLAPLTLFMVLVFISWKTALVLFVCVPLIPVSIAAVQTFAKKLLARYWGQYTTLGDHFLENLQGLTTLKIYQADARQQQIMNEEAEKFRKITMKVLTMQLNSITIMDLVAFGGAALGIAFAVLEYRSETIGFAGCLMMILLAAEFFIPMRTLGSFFHIAMNGMAASDKIFRMLDIEVRKEGVERLAKQPFPLHLSHVSFAYDREKPILRDLSLTLPRGSFTAIVGESGCGKSTTASLLLGEHHDYEGNIYFGKQELRTLSEADRMRFITRVTHQAYLFAGSVREHLLLAKPDADDETLWQVLRQVKIDAFLKQEQGLDTMLKEQGSNLSGGQRQRLALARALLHDSLVYIFDEATSNIDVESETDIMEQIQQLARHKTVLVITHRLANVTQADQICVMENGTIVEQGTWQELQEKKGAFARMWDAQQKLENYGKGDAHETQ